MNNVRIIFLLAVTLLFTAGSATAQAMYQVTITNVTQAQNFTPFLVTSHRNGVSLFTEGSAASSDIEALAEAGETAGLAATLGANDGVVDVQTSSGLLAPGESVTVEVSARRAKRLSLAAMLIPTNDAFVSLNNVAAPTRRGGPLVYYARAYDAGTEVNDELCASIPGPNFTECGGPGGGGSPSGGEEGFVHIHNGIHGVGDLMASTRDWRGVVARIEIRRVRGN